MEKGNMIHLVKDTAAQIKNLGNTKAERQMILGGVRLLVEQARNHNEIRQAEYAECIEVIDLTGVLITEGH